MKKPTPTSLSRRRQFLLASSAGGVVAAAAVAAKLGAPVPSGSSTPDESASGYKVSAHVRNYYRTAKV